MGLSSPSAVSLNQTYRAMPSGIGKVGSRKSAGVTAVPPRAASSHSVSVGRRRKLGTPSSLGRQGDTPLVHTRVWHGPARAPRQGVLVGKLGGIEPANPGAGRRPRPPGSGQGWPEAQLVTASYCSSFTSYFPTGNQRLASDGERKGASATRRAGYVPGIPGRGRRCQARRAGHRRGQMLVGVDGAEGPWRRSAGSGKTRSSPTVWWIVEDLFRNFCQRISGKRGSTERVDRAGAKRGVFPRSEGEARSKKKKKKKKRGGGGGKKRGTERIIGRPAGSWRRRSG